MELQFTNKHIFFALESIWAALDYKFKYTVNQLITANPADDYVQTIDVPEAVFTDIYSALTRAPEGVAAIINKEMFDILEPQIMAVSNIAEYMADTENVEPNEGTRILLKIQEISAINVTTKNAKILNGKTQILA